MDAFKILNKRGFSHLLTEKGESITEIPTSISRLSLIAYNLLILARYFKRIFWHRFVINFHLFILGQEIALSKLCVEDPSDAEWSVRSPKRLGMIC